MPLSHVNPDHYQQQLESKRAQIEQSFAEFDAPALDVFASPPLHFRQRAEFRVWHDGSHSDYCMFHPERPKTPVAIEHFPIGSECLNRAMQQLMEEIRRTETLRQKLFQVEFLTTLSGEVLISLIYHRRLDDDWVKAAKPLEEKLQAKIIGRSKKQKLVLSDDWVTETLQVADKNLRYQQIENSFTQPNATVNQHMLSWARQHSQGLGGDLLELYCGNGNFTLVLAENFRRVLATEISKTSVRSALYNCELNDIDNIDVVRMASEEFSAAMAGERAFRRLKDIDLASYDFSTVFVDPPRAGLDEHTVEICSGFEHIIYVSCNPETLHNNLKTLINTHRIEHFAIFDQFPYTHHIECGVILKRHSY